MIGKYTAAAAAAAACVVIASQANATTYNIVTGGSALMTIDSSILPGKHLGITMAPRGPVVHFRDMPALATELDDQNRPTGRFSQAHEDGENALLALRSRFYLWPTDADGAEIEFRSPTVYYFNFSETEEDAAAGVTPEMRLINYLPTDVANVYTDAETGETHTLTAEQAALLNEGSRRLCCRHSLSGLVVDTAAGLVSGVMDDVAERDIDFDGVIDTFYLFELLETATTADDGLYDVALTDVMASYLNFGFSPAAFEDGAALADNWPLISSGGLGFVGGDVIGTMSYDYTIDSVTAVPLPAALPLLGAGLGVIGVVGSLRNKRKAA